MAFTLGWLVRVVLLAAALLMSPLVLLLALLMPLLQKLLKDFPQGLRSVGEAMQQLGNMVEQLRRAAPDQPFSLPPFIRPALLWGILGLAAVYVVWMLQKRSLQSSPEREEDPEMILRGGELLRHLLSALRSSAQSLAGQMGELGLGGARRMLAAARIRRIYARLMETQRRPGKTAPRSVYAPGVSSHTGESLSQSLDGIGADHRGLLAGALRRAGRVPPGDRGGGGSLEAAE